MEHHDSSSDDMWLYSMMASMHGLGGSSSSWGRSSSGESGGGGLGALGLLAALGAGGAGGAGGFGFQGNALVQGNNLQVGDSGSAFDMIFTNKE